MKNVLKGIIPALAALAITACDNIEQGDRFIYVAPEDPVNPDTATFAPRHAVLIEDFTGQRCSNCPTAIEEIERLQNELGDTAVIAVGIHSGPFGFAGNDQYPGYMTDLGNIYYDYWSIQSQPMGVIDRLGTSAYQQWATITYSQLKKSCPLALSLDNSFDGQTRRLTVTVNSRSAGAVSGAKLQIWLVEDSLVSLQTTPNGFYNLKYVHNHVLRDAVNGTWGTDFSIEADATKADTFTYTVPEGWVAANVSAVAFVYKSGGEGVIQVTKRHITGQHPAAQ